MTRDVTDAAYERARGWAGVRPLALALVLIVTLVVSAPLALAQPFVGELTDRPDDVVTREFRRADHPSVDILAFRSRIVEGTQVEQRVTMAAPPSVDENSLIVRSWFRNSTNGSFYALDLEIHSTAEGRETFVAHARRGAFDNVTPVDATWSIEGNDWVFTFDAALVAPDAECFFPMIYSYLSGPPGSGASDQIGAREGCETAPEPANDAPVVPRVSAEVVGDAPPAAPTAPTVEAPGSRTPAPAPSALLTLLGALGAAILVARRG